MSSHTTKVHSPRFFAIVPAAGRSVRMGRPKLLLPWGDRTLIEQVLDQWRASAANHIVVVVHPDDADLADVCRRAGAEVVMPDAPPPEMKSSIKHALAWVAARHSPWAGDAWLVAPADMPALSPALIDFVIAEHDAADPRIIVPTYGKRRGHPVLFPWPLSADVQALAGDEGLNTLLQRNPVTEIAWPDETAFADVDSPSDYQRLRDESSS